MFPDDVSASMLKMVERCVSTLRSEELSPLPSSLLSVLSELLQEDKFQPGAVRCLIAAAQVCTKNGFDLAPLVSDPVLVKELLAIMSASVAPVGSSSKSGGDTGSSGGKGGQEAHTSTMGLVSRLFSASPAAGKALLSHGLADALAASLVVDNSSARRSILSVGETVVRLLLKGPTPHRLVKGIEPLSAVGADAGGTSESARAMIQAIEEQNVAEFEALVNAPDAA